MQILEVDPVKRRISLGLKQTMRNPWEVFVEKYPPGSIVEGEVKNKTEFGLFLGLDGDVDGMVHLSDLDWKRPGEQVIEEYKKGDMVKATVLDVDVEKERISLGIKQLGRLRPDGRGSRRRTQEGRRRDLRGHRREGRRPRREDRRHRSRRPSSAAPTLPATAATSARTVSRSARRSMPASPSSTARRARSQVSIKALEVAEEKEAIAQYGSSDSGATLGDILGTALKQRSGDKEKGESNILRHLCDVTGSPPALAPGVLLFAPAVRYRCFAIREGLAGQMRGCDAQLCPHSNQIKERNHVARFSAARCGPDRGSPPHAAQTDILAVADGAVVRGRHWRGVAASRQGCD